MTAEIMGGRAIAPLNKVLLNTPTTAHILGGAVIGESPATGVIDPWHRLLRAPRAPHRGPVAIPANLGTNPSLTIAAMAERAMALSPNKGKPDPRPAVGSAYRRLAPVSPIHPAVPEEPLQRFTP